MSDEINVPTTQVDATPSTPTTPVTATPVTPAQAVATPQTPQTPATGAPEGWVPSYRIRESREAAIREANEKSSREIAALRVEHERAQAQIRALTGQQPPQNPEIEAVRGQFSGIYPGLAKLEEKAAQLEALLERAGDLNAQTDHYWTTYGRQTMDRVFDLAEKSLGSPLSDEGKRQLHASFTGFIQSSPELTARYASDPTIVQDFWNTFTNSFIEPARRGASATVAGRAAQIAGLPNDGPSGSVPTSKPAQYNSLDDRVNAGWARLNSKV